MKTLTLCIAMALCMTSCEDAGFVKDSPHMDDVPDTKCTSVFVKGVLTGHVDLNFDSSGSSGNGVISYATPNGIYVKGEQDGINLSIGIPFYTGPGDYAITNVTSITVDILDGGKPISSYISTSGVISVQEFRSPTNEVCYRGLFSFQATNSEVGLTSSISVVNGEFEAIIP
ncbi:hypothetical protein [Reichenbachiella sp.]|uniref:hypothetical protein n=2 Tax=Reichenbachiella sp. TaxID=2184521 RepID=UPI003296D896